LHNSYQLPSRGGVYPRPECEDRGIEALAGQSWACITSHTQIAKDYRRPAKASTPRDIKDGIEALAGQPLLRLFASA